MSNFLVVVLFGHTAIEAAEQALPEAGPAQAAGSHPAVPSSLRAGGFTRVGAWLYAPPIRIRVWHGSPETACLKPGREAPFFRSVPAWEPGGLHGAPQPARSCERLRDSGFHLGTRGDDPAGAVAPQRNQQFPRECHDADTAEPAALAKAHAIPATQRTGRLVAQPAPG